MFLLELVRMFLLFYRLLYQYYGKLSLLPSPLLGVTLAQPKCRNGQMVYTPLQVLCPEVAWTDAFFIPLVGENN